MSSEELKEKGSMIVVIDGIAKTLRQWAASYSIDLQSILWRYDRGVRDYALLDPVFDRLINRQDVKALWGKWKYVGKKKKHKMWNERQRWVYVGKKD